MHFVLILDLFALFSKEKFDIVGNMLIGFLVESKMISLIPLMFVQEI